MKLLLLILAWFRPRATDIFKVNSFYLRGGNSDVRIEIREINEIKEIKEINVVNEKIKVNNEIIKVNNEIKEEEDVATLYKPLNENVGQFISYKDGSYHYETVDSVKERFFNKN